MTRVKCPSHFYSITFINNCPHMGRERALVRDCGTRRQCRLGEGPGHSPVQLGVFYQCVGVPITDESPTHEADEAFRVILELPGHLAGRWVGQPSLAAPSAPISPPLGLLSEWQPQTRGPDWPAARSQAELDPKIGG